MIPLDSLRIPLNSVCIQQQFDLLKVLALAKKGGNVDTLRKEAAELKNQIMSRFDNRRQYTYPTIAKIVQKTDEFRSETNTDVLSISGSNLNTPLKYSNSAKDPINQSNSTNKLLCDILRTEYIGRNQLDQDVSVRLFDETGLNYSTSYELLNSVTQSYKIGENIENFQLLAKILVSNPDQILLQQDKQKQIEKLKEAFYKKVAKTQQFPEYLIAKGLQVIHTNFCSKNLADKLHQFKTSKVLEYQCPCCFYIQGYTKPTIVRDAVSIIKCHYCKVQIIETDGQKQYLKRGEGFCCHLCANKIPGVEQVFIQ